MIQWHQLFGLTLIDFFRGSPFLVELETDLSIKQQLLDVVIIRKGSGAFQGVLPDGLDNLATYNLLSYKSMRQPFDDWTVDELIGHYVNYRKQTSPALNNLLPTEQFQLYGVSTRFPQKLADMVELEELQPGVYQMTWGTHQIRLIVLSEIPPTEDNAIWNLFSSVDEKVRYGATQYYQRETDMSSIINQLFNTYNLEGLKMPYTMEDFRRDYVKEHIDVLSTDEILEHISLNEIVQRLPADERLAGLSVDEILQQLSPGDIRAYLEILEHVSLNEIVQRLPADERLAGLSADEILQQLSPEDIRAYLEKQENQKK